jgi:hypothetical protein
MRIIWNNQEQWFQAELGLNEFWKQDMELVRSIGFKSTGPPQWIWHTSKASLLNKLRDLKPKSGLTITETALEKYKFINEQEQKKQELKKLYEKAKEQAAEEINSANWKDYIDAETGIVCKQVEPLDTKFVPKYVIAAPPEIYCFICGDRLYMYELPDICMYCDETENKPLTKL